MGSVPTSHRVDTAQIADVILNGLANRHRHVHLHLVADLSRTFERGELHEALAKAIKAFPVLGCRYSPGVFRDQWVRWEEDVDELIDMKTTTDVDADTRRHVHTELHHEERPPWAVALLEHSEGARLVVSAHHMLVDGGGLKALGNVLAATLCGKDFSFPTSRARSYFQSAGSLRFVDLPVLVAELVREAIQPLSILRVRPIGGLAMAGGQVTPTWKTVGLSTEGAVRFVEALRRKKATVNDGLVAAVATMAARRAKAGPVMAGYTVDLRRFLSQPRLVATNLHGVCLAVLPRRELEDDIATLEVVSTRIGEQKRRLHGLAYALLNSLALGWLPHSLLRVVGRAFIGNLFSYLTRGFVVTNIGPLDEALAPFGEDLRTASVVGPFIHDLPVPILTATGLRSDLSLQLCSTGSVQGAFVDEYAEELSDVLSRITNIGDE